MTNCRVPNCTKPQYALGVCTEHLSAITKQVKAGQATWKQYEEAGICLPAPKPTNHDKCLTNRCFANPRSRGLCDNCYAAAIRTMKKENLQWPDLEQLGLSRPTRVRAFVKQSLFQEAAKLAIEEKVIKDKASFGVPIQQAAPEQAVSVTQNEPLVPFASLPLVPMVPDGQETNVIPSWQKGVGHMAPPVAPFPTDPGECIENSLEAGQQETSPVHRQLIDRSLIPVSQLGPAALEQMREPTAPPLVAQVLPAVQTPVVHPESPEKAPMATLQGIPIVYEPNLGQQDETLIAPERLAQQIPEAVQVKQTPPVTLAGKPIVELDLSRINASDPEPEPKEPEYQDFPAPPTQIPN